MSSLRPVVLIAALGCFAVACSTATTAPDGGTDAGTDAGPLPFRGALLDVVGIPARTRTPHPQDAERVALQDGAGAWQTVPGTGDGHYDLPVLDAAGHFSLMVICPPSSIERRNYLLQATLAELPSLTLRCELDADFEQVQVTGQVDSWMNGANLAEIDLGAMSFSLGTPGRVSPAVAVAAGTYNALIHTDDGNQNWLQVQLAHNVQLRLNAALDFDLSEVPAPPRAAITVAGFATNENYFISASVLSPASDYPLFLQTRSTTPPAFQATLVPGGSLADSEVNVVTAIAMSGNSTNRVVVHALRDPAPLTLTLPPPLTSSSFSLDVAAAQVQFSWAAGPSSPTPVIYASQGRLSWTLSASHGVLGSTTAYTSPRLSDIPGWNSEWGFVTGQFLGWKGSVATSSDTFDQILAATVGGGPSAGLRDGAEVASALTGGSITP